MNTDIRLSVSFRGHRKRKKLRLVLGPGATDYLIARNALSALDREPPNTQEARRYLKLLVKEKKTKGKS